MPSHAKQSRIEPAEQSHDFIWKLEKKQKEKKTRSRKLLIFTVFDSLRTTRNWLIQGLCGIYISLIPFGTKKNGNLFNLFSATATNTDTWHRTSATKLRVEINVSVRVHYGLMATEQTRLQSI